ncbi:MAG: VOC family protein [Terriglobales bacterium]
MPVQYKPEGYHTVTPTIIVNGAARLHEFLKKVFDAKVIISIPGPNNTIAHSEVQVGDSRLMIADAGPMFAAQSSSFYLYLPDCDAVYQRALAAGAKSEREPKNQFYGDRNASVIDEFGNRWAVGTHVEDVSDEELQRRMKAMGNAG